MKLKKLIPIVLILIINTVVQAQEPVIVSGQVTATETGSPVSQHEVSIGLAVGQILFSDLTDENGFFYVMIPPAIFDTTTTLQAWVSDCNQQIQYLSFVANPNIFFVLDFVICTQNVGCHSNFGYHSDSTDRQTIYFENLSFPVANSVNWLWDFGDGNNSGLFNPVHTYATAGTYNVCLTMADISTNCTSVFCLQIQVDNNSGNCQAAFLVDFDPAHEMLVYFDNQSSPVSYSTRWLWDFGDGMTSGDFEPMHNYYQPGVYTVCLMMVDSTTSCTSTVCYEINVGNNPGDCQAMFSWYSQGLTAAFTDLSTGFPDTWFWNFGDGTSSGEPNPVHTWNQPGTYAVCLTIYNALTLCENTYCALVIVGDTLPDCQAGFTYSDIHYPIYVFTNTSTGQPDQVFWDFGDGTTSNEYNPIHEWQFPGVYSVCLSIYNNLTQCGSSYCENITVGDTLPSCHASYTYEQTGDLAIAFTNNSTGMIDQVTWDFGDGSPFSHEYNTAHTWEQPGIYQVCLAILSNYSGCQDVFCLEITVGDTISACQSAFTALIDSIPGNINHYWFIDESTGSNITSWHWDFGDGSESFIQFTEHTFAGSGTYEVCLTVSGMGNNGYCSSTACQTISTPSYFNFGGQVFAGNYPINNPNITGDTAVVKLFHKTGNHLSEVASGFFYELGYYYFLNVMEGDYVVQAGLTPESNAYQSYLPAYTGETQHWQQSQQVSLLGVDLYNADVYMPELPFMNNGNGFIDGNLICIDNTFADLSDKVVFLSQQGSIVAYSHTDENGLFSFSALPFSTYTLTAEIPGLYSQSLEVTLNETITQLSGNIIQVSHSGVFGIDDHNSEPSSLISVYPNPAEKQINIRITSNENENCVLRLISATGAILKESKTSLTSGDNLIQYDLENFPAGLFTLIFSRDSSQKIQSMRFIKK